MPLRGFETSARFGMPENCAFLSKSLPGRKNKSTLWMTFRPIGTILAGTLACSRQDSIESPCSLDKGILRTIHNPSIYTSSFMLLFRSIIICFPSCSPA